MKVYSMKVRIRMLRARIVLQDSKVAGFNIGSNCGESAGQTIFHAHIHLIPRRKLGVPDPRGDIRGAIPAKQSYSAVN
jgi:diadenosine tetraphosphate (Ap4A) HIT family hydrolase